MPSVAVKTNQKGLQRLWHACMQGNVLSEIALILKTGELILVVIRATSQGYKSSA